ncbi:MAG TPA: hypothetical protein VFH51_13355, partial [Myxococcota bacterium]|nr:hypothetical protein [Myxococcota bacterium]
AALVAAPPMGGFEGGLLVRPLAQVMGDRTLFHEMFAVLAVLAASGVIFAAIYLLWAVQRMFFGPIKHAENEHLRDLSLRETLVLAPLVVMSIVMGVYPQPFLDTINPSMQTYAQEFRARAGLPGLPQGSRTVSSTEMMRLPSLPGAESPSAPRQAEVHELQEMLPWRAGGHP